MEVITEKPKVQFNFYDEQNNSYNNSTDYPEFSKDSNIDYQPYVYTNRKFPLDKNSELRRKESPSRKPGLCVDEICTCGFHRCPRIIKSIPFEGESNYRSEFGPKALPELPPQIYMKPPKPLPFEGQTNYRSEFGESNYRSDYGPKPLPELPPRIEMKLPKSLPFEGESNYRSEFGPKPLPELPPKIYMQPPKPLPFEGESNYRSEFGPKPLPELPPRHETKLVKQLPFEGESSYRTEYIRKVLPVCPVELLPKYPTPTYPSQHVFWDRETKKWY
ncbi:hypothetical protein PFBG_02429 [Plasmodium falciparum 7G8]|uniref:Subpellicular microtubule protein 1 n=1 Tax=Plasmodium falciparum (isolate 7G8) TaxID=57266 RepID=W7F833_PLAF8|nr:hypothetical protein PFBG_02429 [Plasmodium falciparum 7G8]